MAETKTCSKCYETKLVSMFYTESNGRPRSRCIECYTRVRKPAVYVRNRRSPADDEILLREYPEGGWESVAKLTGRDRRNIVNRASRLGVHMVRDGNPDEPWRRVKESPFGIPADDRPEEIKALDMALRSFRECEPAANLTWMIGAVA